MEYEGDSDTNCSLCARNDPQILGNGAGRIWKRRTSRDHQNYSIINIRQNTEEMPGNFKRLDVTQTLVQDHQQTLVGKTC